MKGFEYEKKYQLHDHQVQVFVDRILSLGPIKTYKTSSRDCYYYPKNLSHVLRYRYGEGKSEFTFKQNVEDSFSLRKELNIDLKDCDQKADIEGFITQLSYLVGPEIQKKIEVFDFPDSELCIYEAVSKAKKLVCLEIEAKNVADLTSARSVVQSYAAALSLKDSDEFLVNNFDYFH